MAGRRVRVLKLAGAVVGVEFALPLSAGMLQFEAMASIGHYNRLKVLRETGSGYFLDGEQLGEILLPGSLAPRDLVWGSEIDVFIYPDSEDRLVATTERPLATAGQFAALEVVMVHPSIGTFLDWGLSKDLLLPYREQGNERPEVGDRVAVYIKVDDRSGRVVATTKWQRFLSAHAPDFPVGKSVRCLVCQRTPLGFSVIVEDRYTGLIYHSGLANPLEIGASLACYVARLRPDGKIDLSLDPPATGERVGDLATQILDALKASDGVLEFDDNSSPETIREAFQTSKKAFKKALSALYKHRKIRFRPDGGIELGS